MTGHGLDHGRTVQSKHRRHPGVSVRHVPVHKHTGRLSAAPLGYSGSGPEDNPELEKRESLNNEQVASLLLQTETTQKGQPPFKHTGSPFSISLGDGPTHGGRGPMGPFTWVLAQSTLNPTKEMGLPRKDTSKA